MRRKNKRKINPFYLFILPWIIGFILFTFGPLVYSLYVSFTKWNGVSAPEFIGIQNYVRMFTVDEKFWISLWKTFEFAVISVALSLVLALFLAVLLNVKSRCSYVFRVIYFLPSIVSGVAIYLVWMYLYDANIGFINYLLSLFGIEGKKWLLDPKMAMGSIIFMTLTFCGNQILIFIAGLQGIPVSYYEAAKVNGAGALVTFFKITLPLLGPTVLFNLIMGIINGLQVFTQPYVMTEGGPRNATYVFGIHIFNTAFKYNEFGYASSLAWVMFVIILSLSLLCLKSSQKWAYEGDKE